MTFQLHFGHPDAESYSGLDLHMLRETVMGEAKQSISDLGSDGYDPSVILDEIGVAYNADNDENGELWEAAAEIDIMRRAWIWCDLNFDALLKDAIESDQAYEIKLPDGTRIWVTEDTDDE
jgi:hypothetical protein